MRLLPKPDVICCNGGGSFTVEGMEPGKPYDMTLTMAGAGMLLLRRKAHN